MLGGKLLDSIPRGCGFEPHRRHCVVCLCKNIYPSFVLVQPRNTRPFITEILLMGRKESNQTNKIVVCNQLLFKETASISDLYPHLYIQMMTHSFIFSFKNEFSLSSA